LTVAPGASQEAVERLTPGSLRERPITGGETHVYQVTVADEPLLVLVEQQGIPLVAAAGALTASAPQRMWARELLSLDSPGEQRIEIRPRDRSVGPGRYTIEISALPDTVEERTALSTMSRAGQAMAVGSAEARRQAAGLYREALGTWHALGERRWEAEALDALAALETEDRASRSAAEDGLQALALWRELGEAPLRHQPRRRSFR
jgi:hypothetical protein